MSMMDLMDEALLGVDDDELDYDLEKDEEDALLADDNYEEETYEETQGNENQDHEQQYEEPLQNEEESDILDIDSNVHLDETEEDFSEQTIKENPNDTHESIQQQENDDEEEIEEQKERNRFLNERNSSVSVSVQRTNSHEIPDTLDKVAVQPIPQPNNNNNNQRNGRFTRGNRGRGRGRQNHNRGSVFGRVGNVPMEGKTVLINPHFRGNVQVSENARLVWDANFQGNHNFPQQRYQGPQMAQVAPFQSQPAPWITPPYAEPNNSFNHPPMQPNYQEPPPPIQYNQPSEIMNIGIRPLMQNNNQPPPFVAQQPPPQQQQQGNFRGRDVRFQNQTSIPPLMMNNSPTNFNQQQNYQGRNNFNFPENQNMPNQNRPFINQNQQNQPPVIQMQPNYPPAQNFDQPPPNYIQQTQFNQNRHVQPGYEQYNEHNQFQNPHNQFPSSMHNNQNFQGQNFQQPVNNYEPNFIPNQPAQEPFLPKPYNHQYNQNRQNNQHQRHQMNNYNNRTPPKRRSFENTVVSGDRDLPKKKKRSMELSNLHEVPTVDMPDTTTEEKEEEDEYMKEYRQKIEEQRKLREIILRGKEERRKLAAAQKAEAAENSSAGNPVTLQPRMEPTTNQQPNPIIKQQQQIQTVKQPIQQWQPQHLQQQPQQQQAQNLINRNPQQQQAQNPMNRNFQQGQNLMNRNLQQHGQNLVNRNPQQQQQQQRPRQQMQQRNPMQNNQQRPQNIQVQTNAAGQRTNQGRVLQQRRIQQQQQQANIVITQKNEVQQQRIVMLKQNSNAAKAVPNRRVVLKGMNTVSSEPSSGQSSQESPENGTLSSFLSNRKVISNSSGSITSGVELNQATLLETPCVVVSNLAAGTTDVKIRKLCQGLGPIQNNKRHNRRRKRQRNATSFVMDVD